MQYAILIYEPSNVFAERERDPETDPYVGAWRAYYQSLVQAGVYVGGTPLHLPETATTIRKQHGKSLIQDGPYAEAKEQLAGFILIEAPSLDVALEHAGRCPATTVGAVEVRPIAPEVRRRITCE